MEYTIANPRMFLYKTVHSDGSWHVDYKYENALKRFNDEADCVKMYAYTKTIKPTYVLLFWKKDAKASFSYCVQMQDNIY